MMPAWLYQRIRFGALLTLIGAFCLCLPTLSPAAQVSLAWEPTQPAPEGYRLYQRTQGQTYDYDQPVWSGTQTSATVGGLADLTLYYYVVRAYVGQTQSADSNEVSYLSSPPPVTTYVISASAGPNGAISPAGQVEVNQGAGRTFTITPDPGYRVNAVSVDGISVGAVASYTFDSVTANHSLEATFAPNSHTVSATAGANGSISPAGQIQADYGSSKTFTITPDAGYHIANVTLDGVSVGAVGTITIDPVRLNHAIHAVFSPIVYTLTAVSGPGGAISPSGQITVNHGASLNFTFTADNGHDLHDVVINGQSIGTPASHLIQNIGANYSIQAHFVGTNQPPTADAGPNQTVEAGRIVTLNGNNSFDPDDGIAAFVWRQIGGPAVTLTQPDQPHNTFVAPNVGQAGASLVFELTVTDFSGAEATDTCIVNVTWVNQPPTADAGGPQFVTEGMDVVLDARRSSDPDDGIVGYHWTQLQGPEVTLCDDRSATASFVAPATGPEGVSLTFELTVTDAGGLQDTDSCLVTVEWVNTPPLADAGPDQGVQAGDEVQLDGSNSSDPDGDAIAAYHWRQTFGPPVELSDPTAHSPVFLAPEVESAGAALSFKLTVTDSGGLQDMDTCQVFVHPSEQAEADTTPPTLVIDSPANDPLTISWFRINVSGKAWDNQGVHAVMWENSRGGTGTAHGTDQWEIQNIPLRYGSNTITVTAVDAAGNTAAATTTVNVRFRWWW